MDRVNAVLDNQYMVIVTMFLTMCYISMSRVQLPTFIRDLFKNDIFRVLFLSLLLTHSFKQRPSVSIVVVVIFLYTMHLINQEEIRENFEYLKDHQRYRF